MVTTAVGLITDPAQAEAILQAGDADLIALARAFLYQPRWGWQAAAALGGEVQANPVYWRSRSRIRVARTALLISFGEAAESKPLTMFCNS